MKTRFTILTIFLSLVFFINNIYGEDLKRVMPLQNDSISMKDTLSNYHVTTNGRLNSVQITSKGQAVKSDEVKQARTNTIEINGEQNSVNISENGSGGTIRIQQNGSQNKINITQTNEKTNK